jgi:hypothetical protein
MYPIEDPFLQALLSGGGNSLGSTPMAPGVDYTSNPWGGGMSGGTDISGSGIINKEGGGMSSALLDSWKRRMREEGMRG